MKKIHRPQPGLNPRTLDLEAGTEADYRHTSLKLSLSATLHSMDNRCYHHNELKKFTVILICTSNKLYCIACSQNDRLKKSQRLESEFSIVSGGRLILIESAFVITSCNGN